MKISLFFKPPRYSTRTRILFKLLKQFNPDNVLEIGYGDGWILQNISYRKANRYGLEKSKSAIKFSKENFKKKGIVNLDALSLSPKQDLVLILETVGYIGEMHEFLSQVRNILSEEGFVIFSITLNSIKGAEEKITGMKTFTEDEFSKILKNNGFIIVDSVGYGDIFLNNIHNLRKIARSYKSIDNTSVEESWKNTFDSNFFKILYFFLNSASLLINLLQIKGQQSGLIIISKVNSNV